MLTAEFNRLVQLTPIDAPSWTKPYKESYLYTSVASYYTKRKTYDNMSEEKKLELTVQLQSMHSLSCARVIAQEIGNRIILDCVKPICSNTNYKDKYSELEVAHAYFRARFLAHIVTGEIYVSRLLNAMPRDELSPIRLMLFMVWTSTHISVSSRKDNTKIRVNDVFKRRLKTATEFNIDALNKNFGLDMKTDESVNAVLDDIIYVLFSKEFDDIVELSECIFSKHHGIKGFGEDAKVIDN